MKYTLIYMLACLMFSCTTTDKNTEVEQNEKADSTIENIKAEQEFIYNPSKFPIQKGQLGDIKIGMTVSEAEEKFSGLRKETGLAADFGYGGGSPAYLYYSNDKVAFGLITTLDTDTVLFIIAADPQLKTTNGLNPTSTVKEILGVYPDMKVNQDLMNGWEYFYDTTNQWEYVFMTDPERQVGKYSALEVPSEPKTVGIKSDWITIK